MKALHDDLVFFARLINALRPWLGQVVTAGGWAQRLHRVHPQVITATVGSVTDTVRQAVVEARGAGRELSSDQLAETCRLGLGRILAD